MSDLQYVLFNMVQSCHSTLKRELLTVYPGIFFFRYMLKGDKFTALVDRKSFGATVHFDEFLSRKIFRLDFEINVILDEPYILFISSLL